MWEYCAHTHMHTELQVATMIHEDAVGDHFPKVPALTYDPCSGKKKSSVLPL